MSKYRVTVWEGGMSCLFQGIKAESNNEACAEAMTQYLQLMAKTEIKGLSAVARKMRNS